MRVGVVRRKGVESLFPPKRSQGSRFLVVRPVRTWVSASRSGVQPAPAPPPAVPGTAEK